MMYVYIDMNIYYENYMYVCTDTYYFTKILETRIFCLGNKSVSFANLKLI